MWFTTRTSSLAEFPDPDRLLVQPFACPFATLYFFRCSFGSLPKILSKSGKVEIEVIWKKSDSIYSLYHHIFLDHKKPLIMALKNVILILLFLSSVSGRAQSSASHNVMIFDIEAPQLDTLRTIRIYLPEGYEQSKERYPVVYMHDAQNLFDSITAFAGEWHIDEFLNSQKGQKVIVVGIDHGNARRIAELTPFANEDYGGGEGAAYLNFLVHTLKPHIDSTYRSIPEAENTVVMGSSLGGLISFYAAVKHPEVFQKAGIFSPSFWFSEEIFEFTEAAEIPQHARYYFVGGMSESEEMTAHLMEIKQLLLKKGMPAKNLKFKLVEDGKHNEAFWSREFPEAFKWLFPTEQDNR
jgi:predicted alpha/beta superfamily hydrolase